MSKTSPERFHTTLYLSPETARRFRVRCAELGTSMTAVLRGLVDTWLAAAAIAAAGADGTSVAADGTFDVKSAKSVSITRSGSDILSPEALSWAHLAEAAKHIQRDTGRELYESVWIQLRMCARDSLREQGLYDAAEKLPDTPWNAQTTGRVGRA
jgi:hypothetical protein